MGLALALLGMGFIVSEKVITTAVTDPLLGIVLIFAGLGWFLAEER